VTSSAEDRPRNPENITSLFLCVLFGITMVLISSIIYSKCSVFRLIMGQISFREVTSERDRQCNVVSGMLTPW
jgi:hypothetical protein